MAQAAERLPVRINAREYMIDPEQYQRTTVPVLREQRDTSEEPGEQRLNTQMWVRSQTDWSLGAGQEFLDNSDSDRRRFYTSSGIDPWTKGKVSLLPECESKNNAKTWTSGGILKEITGSNGTTYLYAAVGTDLFYSSNFDEADGSVTWTTVTALGSPETITDFTSDGATVFIAYGAARALATTTVGATTQPSTLGALTPDWVRVVGGKLLVGDGSVLNEVNASGATAGLTSTLPHAGATWVTACAGPVGIYAASNTDTGSVHFVPIASDDGLVDSAQQVAQLPRGETINDMIAYGGFTILATSKGLRLAAVETQSGGLTYGPVNDDGGEAFCLATDDRFVWWGGSAGQVWRADLSKFTETLVPAYASDLLSVGDGNSLGNVSSLVRSGGTFFWDEGNGVQGPESTGDVVASGTLTVGDVRWNSQIDKVLRTIETRSSPTLVAGSNTAYDSATTFDDADVWFNGSAETVPGTIEVVITTDDGLATESLTLVDRQQKVLDPALTSDRFEIVFTLSRDATTTSVGPILESWLLQSFPSPTRIDEIILPVVLKRRVATSRGMGAAKTVRAQEEYDALRALMSATQVVTFEEGSRVESVVVDQMSMSASRLSDDGDWWDGTLTVRLLTVPE